MQQRAAQRDIGIGGEHAMLAQQLVQAGHIGDLARQRGLVLAAGHQHQRHREDDGATAASVFRRVAQRIPHQLIALLRRHHGQRHRDGQQFAARQHLGHRVAHRGEPHFPVGLGLGVQRRLGVVDQHIGQRHLRVVLARIRRVWRTASMKGNPAAIGKPLFWHSCGPMVRRDSGDSSSDVPDQRQKIIISHICEKQHVDTRYRNLDNSFSLRCSNCFLIVSPLFLLLDLART